MLHIDTHDLLEPLAGDVTLRCSLCQTRRATWIGETRSGNRNVTMCAWCVLYGGSSWGHEHRDEVLMAGVTVRQAALRSANPKVHVPELDERHRLNAEDAEKLMLGVGYTSAHLRPQLAVLLGRGETGG